MWFCNWKRRPSRRVADARRVRLCLEVLEDRAVPAALQPGLPFDGPVGPAVTTVYTESNNPAAGQNAVLAFRQDGNGNLTQIGTFLTGGAGQLNLPPVIGPDDSSSEVVATSDGQFLFAVNQGSNSVTAFRIDRNGGLDRIGTFDSGGVQPDSIGIAGDRLYVSNRGDSAVGHPGTVAPNITAFTIESDGSLTPIPASTVTFPVDTSPSQNLISPDGRFLFNDILGVPGSTAPQDNTFAPFQIQSNGDLQLAPGGNVAATGTPFLLGAAANPNRPIIYGGLILNNQIAVFTYDNTGQLTFSGTAGESEGPCWLCVSGDGKYLYATNTASDSVTVFSLANPLHPAQIQVFALGGPHAPAGSPPGTLQTGAFQLALSPDGRSLYVIGQSQSPTGAFAQGNQLHILSVAADGTLSEPRGPILLSSAGVPGNAHPQGIAVVAGRGDEGGGRGDQGGRRGRGDSESNRTNAIDAVFSTDAAAIPSSSIPHSSSTIPAVPDLEVASLALSLAHLKRRSK